MNLHEESPTPKYVELQAPDCVGALLRMVLLPPHWSHLYSIPKLFKSINPERSLGIKDYPSRCVRILPTPWLDLEDRKVLLGGFDK